jgi:hypothetical protein
MKAMWLVVFIACAVVCSLVFAQTPPNQKPAPVPSDQKPADAQPDQKSAEARPRTRPNDAVITAVPVTPMSAAELDERLQKIDKQLVAIDNNVKPDQLANIGVNLLSSFLWDMVTLSESPAGLTAQISALVGVVLTALRSLFIFKDRKKVSGGRILLDVSVTLYAFVISIAFFAYVFLGSGASLATRATPASDVAGLRADMKKLRTSVDQLRAVPTTQVLARAAVLERQMQQLERTITKDQKVQMSSLADQVAAIRDDTAAFSLQLIEAIAIFLTMACAIAVCGRTFEFF